MTELHHTYVPAARSWIVSTNAAGSAFRSRFFWVAWFRRAESPEKFRGGVAVGDQINLKGRDPKEAGAPIKLSEGEHRPLTLDNGEWRPLP